MPIVTNGNIGSQRVAKGGGNFVSNTGAIITGNAFQSLHLDTPGLPKVSFICIQTTGAAACEFTPQFAVRRENQGDLVWYPLAPAALLNPAGDPTVFEFNVAAQAIRGAITNNSGANVAVTMILTASG
jgi:hypothetical protein